MKISRFPFMRDRFSRGAAFVCVFAALLFFAWLFHSFVNGVGGVKHRSVSVDVLDTSEFYVNVVGGGKPVSVYDSDDPYNPLHRSLQVIAEREAAREAAQRRHRDSIDSVFAFRDKAWVDSVRSAILRDSVGYFAAACANFSQKFFAPDSILYRPGAFTIVGDTTSDPVAIIYKLYGNYVKTCSKAGLKPDPAIVKRFGR